MKIKQYAAFALMGLALGACKRPTGDNAEIVEPEGELVKASLKVSIPKGIRTYAPGGADPNAHANEITANRIDVFIYDDGGSYAVSHHEFTTPVGIASPTNPGEFGFSLAGTPDPGDEGDDFFVTSDFDVREGEKLIYVGINLPTFIIDRLKTGYYVNEVFENPDLISELAKTPTTTGGSSNVAFFNTAVVAENINSDGLTLDVSVSRLVAKVLVKAVDVDGNEGATATWDVSGGTISELEFAIGQRNNQMYVSPLRGTNNDEDPNFFDSTIPFVGALSPSGSGIQILQDVDDSEYASVNGTTGVDPKDDNTFVRYATENTSELYRHQDVTYVSIRAKFAPHRFGGDPETGELPDDGPIGDNTTPPTTGFYAVFTGDPTGEDALGVRYFNADPDRAAALEEARNFVMGTYFEGIANGGTAIGLGDVTDAAADPLDEDAEEGEVDHYIHFYDQSHCYYRVYLNPNDGIGGTGTGTGSGNYKIERNTVYLATIKGVNYIGTTHKDHLPGGLINDVTGKGTPTYPGNWYENMAVNPAIFPVLPTDQITALDLFDDLGVEITLEDWIEDPQDYEVY